MTKPLTGRKVFFIFLAGFGVIIAANLTLAFSALRTFPGLEVKNSYVASQSFDEERRAQEALGWSVEATLEEGQVEMILTGPDGTPVLPAEISAVLGRTTLAADDMDLDFRRVGTLWRATLPDDAPMSGNWLLRLEMRATDGTGFRRNVPLRADRAS